MGFLPSPFTVFVFLLFCFSLFVLHSPQLSGNSLLSASD